MCVPVCTLTLSLYLYILSHFLTPVSQRVRKELALVCVCVFAPVHTLTLSLYLYILSNFLTPVSQMVLAIVCVCVCVPVHTLTLSLYLYILSHILTPVSQRVRKELALAPPSSIAPHVFLRLISGRAGGLLCAKKKLLGIFLRLKQVTLVCGRARGFFCAKRQYFTFVLS